MMDEPPRSVAYRIIEDGLRDYLALIGRQVRRLTDAEVEELRMLVGGRLTVPFGRERMRRKDVLRHKET
jgi:hypothetical protein